MANGARGEKRFNPWKFTRNAVIIAAVIALGVYVWLEHLEDRLIPKNFGVVEAGHVYRSARLTPGTLEQVARRHGIRTVIDFGAYDGKPETAKRIHEMDAALGLTRYVLPMKGDGTGDPNNYVEALRIISDESTHPVLVQCSAGAQRTGVCITLYRNILKGEALVDAYADSFEYGHEPEDNSMFPIYLGKWRDEIEHSVRTGERIEEEAIGSRQ